MADELRVLDRWGRPVRKSVLKREVTGATMGGVRSPISGYPADGLNPVRLAQILRQADQGDPLRYLELAETIEERDPHYLGVLATRKRSVSQIDITVEAASDDGEDAKKAEMVEDWLKRDELVDEIFNILDCIGKGYSFTEIIWDTSMGQWRPDRLEWRDPRWFRFDRETLARPMKLSESGDELELDPFKFIYAQIRAKSGLALRSGLARVATWGWMFKAFTQRDWAIFTQTYGQPLRIGKFGAGATEQDRNTLFNAVANIAGDCAAIIPESMTIDFVESKTIGSSSDLYEKRSDWLDRQISKAVLGQTATTDAIAGGHAVGQEHREVQEDIERADARALSAILNRDLIRPWIDLEYGPQETYPRLRIERVEKEDLTQLSSALGTLVPLGLKVSMREVRDRFGFSEPEDGAEILVKSAPKPPPGDGEVEEKERKGPIEHSSGVFERGSEEKGTEAAQGAEIASAGRTAPRDPVDDLTDGLARAAAPGVGDMIGQIEAMLEAAGSLGEFREMLLEGFPEIDASQLTRVMAEAMLAAHAGGRAMVEEEAGD